MSEIYTIHLLFADKIEKMIWGQYNMKFGIYEQIISRLLNSQIDDKKFKI